METVGDKYMLVSGLPNRDQRHSQHMARAALEMLATAQDISVAGQHVLVQIGVHCGEVVAGVVGQKRPHYAVFGSSVCVASRMESTSQPGRINCSETFHKCVMMVSLHVLQYFIYTVRTRLTGSCGRSAPVKTFSLRIEDWFKSKAAVNLSTASSCCRSQFEIDSQ